MYISQHYLKQIDRYLVPGKVLIIYGPRRVGKTTLLHHYLDGVDEKVLLVNGDDLLIQDYLGSQSIQKLTDFIGGHTLLAIDEAQYIERIGINLKLIADHIPGLKIIATGSSSFDLARETGEPLTGRKYVLLLYPLSQLELSQVENRHETDANLESRLIYGSYPEVITNNDNPMRETYLRELISSYLFKDILQLEEIRHSDKLSRLLQLLAFQIGKEVSHSELGRQLGMGKNTVERYLDLLEKVFVIRKLTGFSRNLRKEITKNHRYYFFDLGIRNALINNFNPLSLRADTGQLWENYIILERIKLHTYRDIRSHVYFWRTYDRKEIDLVEDRGGQLSGYEIKWKKEKVKPPGDWTRHYPGAGFEVITRKNYLDFIANLIHS